MQEFDKSVVTDAEIVDVAKDMAEAEEMVDLANAPSLGERAIRKMQLQAFRMSKKKKRLGRHVVHPTKKRKFSELADKYYENIVGNTLVGSF